MNRFLVFSLLMMVMALNALEIDPSQKKVPEQFYNSKGGFSIFTGDPERIQKANKIDFKDFEAKVVLQPATLSISGSGLVIKVDFSVKNIGKKTYVLSYPDAQRYDVWIKDANGQVVYKWSADKIFVQQVGTSLINANDRIAFLPQVNLSDFDSPATPGTYTVEVSLANYPDVKATTTLTLTP
ncbi:MAG: BsuPI-related putative proteinase inhibitor [Verrucomicrobiota bacterium]